MVDRGHLTRKHWEALVQKVSFCATVLIVEGTLASCLAVSMDMCGKCAPAKAVHHKMAVTRNWKSKIFSRQDEVTLSSVIQSAELENWCTIGDWLQDLRKFCTAKIHKK